MNEPAKRSLSSRGGVTLAIVVVSLVAALLVGNLSEPTWTTQAVPLDVQEDEAGEAYVGADDEREYLDEVVAWEESALHPDRLAAEMAEGEEPAQSEQVVVRQEQVGGETVDRYYRLTAMRHLGLWSLLPAAVAIVLCLMTREPLTSLAGAIVVGALMLGQYDLTGVLVERLGTPSAAGILVLYLWLLGGLLGIWSRTGAAQAFAEMMTAKFVRGPRTAKLSAWLLGVLFFQGGTMSTVLVGTSVKPISDKERISHEELSYIVDSTASPIASVLAFNAWPAYVAGFLFVPGVAFLATDADRLAFFFASVPLSFYGIFAVLGTFLLCMDKAPILGSQFRRAIKRARETGELDAHDASPLSSKELEKPKVPEGYRPNVADFFVPLLALIGIAIGTFMVMGSPQVLWAFGSAVVIAGVMALARGMSLANVMDGFGEGLKGVVYASVILMLAITIGMVSEQTGGGIYLVDLLGERIPPVLLPLALLGLSVIIAFSTGTSFGTYAVAFPLVMPLAWAVATSAELANPELFMMICFATVLNGAVYGDQCSPISDTTILSSMTSGADLMDHVKTQIIPATAAVTLAAILWTAMVVVLV
ncbi:MAG: Na+/H+ antiporter NhaC family protein [Phycisphaeraceae bacterium]